jgi:hypothetical protein
MVLKDLTEEEKANWIKRNQLVFILKLNSSSIDQKTYLIEFAVEDYVKDLSDEEVLELWVKHEEKISNQEWIDLYPMYFHRSEFEEALILQAENYLLMGDKLPTKSKTVLRYIEENIVDKFNKLSLKQKIELFWFTHQIQY